MRVNGKKAMAARVALLCLVLAFSSVECVFACAFDPCPAEAKNVPPCHKHQQPLKHDTSQHCGHASLVADYRATADTTADGPLMQTAGIASVMPMPLVSTGQNYRRRDL